MDFNREKKNSDIGLDLLANQNKIKTESSSPKINNITIDKTPNSPPINNNENFNNFSENNVDFSFKEEEDNVSLNQPRFVNNNNNNYSFNPQNNFSNNNQVDLDSNGSSVGQTNYDNVTAEKSYDEIMNEKYELMYKIDSLRKRGIKIPGNVSIESNIDEIKYVYNRVVKDRERLNGVKFARKMLMACCTGIEFLNNRFDPFDIKLDGWSESVHENVGDYDEVFEELYDFCL